MSDMHWSSSLPSGTRSAPVRVTGAGSSSSRSYARPLRAAAGAALVLFMLLGAVAVGQAAEEKSSLSGTVNLNTANSEQLQLLPGVGEVRANAIIDARKKGGGFKSVDDLVEVKGVGPTLLERLRPYVAVTGKTTIKVL